MPEVKLLTHARIRARNDFKGNSRDWILYEKIKTLYGTGSIFLERRVSIAGTDLLWLKNQKGTVTAVSARFFRLISLPNVPKEQV